MATRRMDKVNELMKREISAVIQRDFEWSGTIVSVLEVNITDDLKEGRVWIGVVGRMVPPQVIEKLNKNKGYIQKTVSRRVVLKSTPRLTFKYDNSARHGVGLVNLLDDIEENLPKAPPLPEGEYDPEI